MKKLGLLVVLFCMTGCNGCNKIKKSIGIEQSEEDKQKQQEEERRAKEEAQRKLNEADILVKTFIDRIAQPSSDGGFQRHEGLNDIDPWGNQLKVDYKQEGINEIVTVRCAGPDSEFDTQDDLIRTRTTSNFWGFHRGLSGLQWLLVIWLGSAIIGTILYLIVGVQRHSKGKHRGHPIVGVFILFLLGPIALLFYSIAAVASVLGEGIDFDFGDIDFDFGD
jgi:hypothetical protein